MTEGERRRTAMHIAAQLPKSHEDRRQIIALVQALLPFMECADLEPRLPHEGRIDT